MKKVFAITAVVLGLAGCTNTAENIDSDIVALGALMAAALVATN